MTGPSSQKHDKDLKALENQVNHLQEVMKNHHETIELQISTMNEKLTSMGEQMTTLALQIQATHEDLTMKFMDLMDTMKNQLQNRSQTPPLTSATTARQDKMHQGDLDEVHSSLNPGDSGNVKIGVIDYGCDGTLAEDDRKYFKSLSVRHQSHSLTCKNKSNTMICPRGFSCASIICSTSRKAKFLNVCDKEFEGVYPDAHLYIYIVGCGSCRPAVERNLISNTVKALDKAIKDKVKVVLVCMDMPMETVHKYKNIKDDRVEMKLLDVHNNGILPFVPTGNKGPVEGSTQYGGPWSMIVGACTDKKILETNMEIATTDEHGDIKWITTLKGGSLNVIETKYLPLCVYADRTRKAGILLADLSDEICYLLHGIPDFKPTIEGLHVTTVPLASITIDQVYQLQELNSQHGGRLFVKFLQSKYNYDDKKGDFVTNFSSRGPSRLYGDNLVPDLVAPGHAVLMPHPRNITLNNIGEPIFEDTTIASGTSYACAQVAAYALKVFSQYPDWLPSAVKSALITTASSFTARCNPDNEFAFGAGSVNINRALNPGLVYEETSDHFNEYVEQDRTIFDLNLPTFAASLAYSHHKCELIFKRELKNVSGRDEKYQCVVDTFDKSLDPDVEITAEPEYLEFRPGEKKKFELHVKILPRPHPGPTTRVSAILKWKPGTVDHHPPGTVDHLPPVCSPIFLYHQSTFDDFTWFENERYLDDLT